LRERILKVFHTLHPGGHAFDYQEKWAQDDAKYKLAAKARQIGITTTEAIKSFLDCLSWRESKKNPLPLVIVFVSPSMRQSSRLMQYIQRARTAYEKEFQESLTFKKEREDCLIFDNHCEIWSLPNNPRTIEGIDTSRGIIDECGNFAGREDQEIYESMMGSLGAKGGGLVIFGKPRGRRGLFWKLYDPYGEYAKQFSTYTFTWEVRAKVDERYRKTVEEQRVRMSSLAFDENYNCAFIDEGIVMFPWEVLDRQTRDILQWTDDSKRDPDALSYMGVDFGKKVSQTAVTIVSHGERTQVKYHRVTKAPFEEQLQWIGRLIDTFKPVKCYVDKTGLGVPLEEKLVAQFSTRVEGVQFSGQTKERLVLTTLNLLESGQLEIPDIQELKEQLHGIEKEVLESGKIRYTGKRSETDFMDDRAWSLFLACSHLGDQTFDFMIVDEPKHKPMSDFERWRRDIEDVD